MLFVMMGRLFFFEKVSWYNKNTYFNKFSPEVIQYVDVYSAEITKP